MKTLFSFFLLALTASAQVPSYKNFNSNDFTMANFSGQSNIQISPKFLTTNFWGTNAVNGLITNKNYGYGVKADDMVITTNQVLLWAEDPLPVGTNLGFRFQPFSFMGGAFNIDSGGDGSIFGLRTANLSNYFQIGGNRESLSMEVVTNWGWVHFGTNTTFKTNITVKGRLTNEVLTASSPVFTDGNKALTSSGTLPVSPNSFIPNLGYEAWDEPWGSGDAAAGTIGLHGWTATSAGAGGGSVNWSNAVGHWGIISLTTSASANSTHSIALGDSPQSKPWIPSLSAVAGWTNTWVWRLRQTNNIKVFFGLIGNANYTQAILENSMGFLINTTNSASIQGQVSTASAGTTTNIVNVVADQWYTNVMWSHVAGTVCFSVDGTIATLTTPNFPLTPSFGQVKPTATTANTFEVDRWILIKSD